MKGGDLMETIILAGAFGFLGGIIRSAVGIFKAMSWKMKIYWNYAIFTMLVSGFIGILTGTVFSFDYRLSILAGYSGTDILEGIYKSFKVEKVYVK